MNFKNKKDFFYHTLIIRDIYNNLESILNGIIREKYFNYDYMEDIQTKIETDIFNFDKTKMKPINNLMNKFDLNKMFIEQIKNNGKPPKIEQIKNIEIYNTLKYIFDSINNYLKNNKNFHIKNLYKEHIKTINKINELLNEYKKQC